MEKTMSALWNSFTLQHKEQVGKIQAGMSFSGNDPCYLLSPGNCLVGCDLLHAKTI